MKLHLDPSAFQTLLLNQSKSSGVRADILEKDYYVTLMLKELAEKQAHLPAYFKGGTALYKAIGCIRRYSEDIDLTVSLENCPSRNQGQKRLEAATQGYMCLSRNKDDEANRDFGGSITTIYNYRSVVDLDRRDMLQRFERVKIEATSFTVSEPHEPIEIFPLILDIATRDERGILSTEYGVDPFYIDTIKLERIFIDKIFAAEFYYSRKEYFDTAKHIYDMVVLLKNEKIRKMLVNREVVEYLIGLKRKEELHRKGSELTKKAISQFGYITSAMNNEELRRQFSQMQNIYVFMDKYLINEQELRNSLSELRSLFQNL